MAKVVIENLVKKFKDVYAVKNLNLEIKDKEFLVLLGPSGCGKTTALRCISGLEIPDEGKILIGDTLVNELEPKDRDIAMVFQSYALYPHKTVYDNMAMPLKARKVPKSEIDKRVKETASLLRIKHLLERKPKQLSGGEAQRTALGRAIVREPQVFLMDEPLSNLDALLRVQMRAELKKLQEELGVTTIYVTHDQIEALTMGDRIAIMRSGVLRQLAHPREIYNNPSDKFVGSFIGTPPMNFIDCTFKEKDGRGYLEGLNFAIMIPNTLNEVIQKQSITELILGIRPDDITLSNKKIEDKTVEANVYLLEHMGSKTIIDFELENSLIKVETTEDKIDLKPGDKANLVFNKKKMHIFDKKTEKAII